MPKGQDWKLNSIWFFKLLFSLKCFSLLGEYSRYRIWHSKLSRSISRNLRLYHKVNPFNSYPKMVRHTLKILQHLLYVWSGTLCMNVIKLMNSLFLLSNVELAKSLKLMNQDISNVGVTPHFSTGQILWKKILRKDKYWHN